MTKQLIVFKIVSTTQILIDLKSNPAPTSSSQSCLDPSRLDKINVYLPTLTFINDYWKKHGFDYSFFRKVMSLLFNTLSRLVIAFLPRSKHFLVSWLQSPSTVILRSKKIKSVTASTFSPSICHEVRGPDAMILVFLILSFKSVFHSPPSPSSRGSLVSLHFLPLEQKVSPEYLRFLMYFSWKP